jgi:hypothetical protein
MTALGPPSYRNGKFLAQMSLCEMELKVKGKFVTSSKVKFFQNPSCHILEKINENYNKK